MTDEKRKAAALDCLYNIYNIDPRDWQKVNAACADFVEKYHSEIAFGLQQPDKTVKKQ